MLEASTKCLTSQDHATADTAVQQDYEIKDDKVRM